MDPRDVQSIPLFAGLSKDDQKVKLGGRRAAELGPGDFFGEIGLLAGDRRVASVVAASPMSLIVLTGSQLRAIDSRMPGVAERIRSAMAQRIAANQVTSG
jgi:CRP-like cAMP-binding protein